jgi:hypothetical protein
MPWLTGWPMRERMLSMREQKQQLLRRAWMA